MKSHAADVQSFISKELHSLLFLEEFVFSRNKFSPPESSELELADAVVLLGDVLLIYQIKERAKDQAGGPEAERSWFQSKVLGKAKNQIRDTLRYLQTYREILIPNERGHVFNLAESASAKILKIIVYRPSANLPDDCRSVRYYESKSAGFIHIVDANDYLEIGRTLRVPQEVVRYFEYRESVLTRFAGEEVNLPEAAIAGHFIGGKQEEVLPTVESAKYLHQLVQDDREWDLAPFLRGFHDHLSEPGVGDDYYAILIEFAKLPRSAWRKVKERIVLCIEKVQKDEFTRPYRISVPETGCGFVFIPVISKFVKEADWLTVRANAIQNFTLLHKYDQKLSKCIGILVARDGEYFDIQWCLVSHEWTEDPELQKALDDNSPFRPVQETRVPGYVLDDQK